MSIDLSALVNLPPDEAIAAFKSKGFAISWDWHDTWKEANAAAFTVAKLVRMDVLGDIHTAVGAVLERGETQRWFDQRLTGLLQQKGWWGRKIVVGSDGQAEVVQEGSPRRLQTIFRTNVQTAYAAGRWQRFIDNAGSRPYLQYVAVLDGRTRPAHARLNGKIFPIDSPVWSVIGPPNGFNCRCAVRALSARDLERRGLRVETEARIIEREVPLRSLVDRRTGEVDPQKLVQRGVSVPDPARPGKRTVLWADVGWDYNPGAAGAARIADLVERKRMNLPKELAQAVSIDARKPAPQVADKALAYWDSTTRAGRWHDASFANAPDWLKKQIASVGDPRDLKQTPGMAASCSWRQHIEMGSRRLDDPRAQVTWRHEYGHHLDGNMHPTLVYASSDRVFSEALQADAKRLVAHSGSGAPSAAVTARQAFLADQYRVAAEDVARSGDWETWIAERFKRHGIDYRSEVMPALRQHTVFANALQGIDLEQRLARIATAWDLQDAQGLMDALLGKGNLLEVSACGSKGVCGALSDLIGSVTLNRVAGRELSLWGHSSAYYAKHESLAGTEVWANLTCLHGEGGVFWRKVLERFTPDTNRVFLEVMTDV